MPKLLYASATADGVKNPVELAVTGGILPASQISSENEDAPLRTLRVNRLVMGS